MSPKPFPWRIYGTIVYLRIFNKKKSTIHVGNHVLGVFTYINPIKDQAHACNYTSPLGGILSTIDGEESSCIYRLRLF